MSKPTNKLAMEQILVAYCPGATDQTLAQGALVDASTSLGLGDGNIGILSWDHKGSPSLGNFLATGDDSSDVRAIKILQGTPASSNITTADPWEAGHKGYVESGIIRKDKIRSVYAQTCRAAVYGAVGATQFDSTVPKDTTEYKMYVTLDSVRNDQFWGPNDETLNVHYTTPDYTALSTTSPMDHLLQNVLFEMNKYSRLINLSNYSYAKGNRNVLALGINLAGGSGTAIGTIDCGDSVNVMTDGSTTSAVVFDEAMVMSVAEIVARMAADSNIVAANKIDGSSTIEVIDLSTAGDAAKIDAFIILGLPEQKSVAFDNVAQIMVQPSLELGGGFQVSPIHATAEASADEGAGYGWQWLIQNDNRWQLAINNMQNHPHGDYYNEGEKYINPDYRYTSYIIEYYDTESTLTTEEVSPKRLILLLQCGITCGTVAATATNIGTNLTNDDTPGSRVNPMTTVDVGCFGGGSISAATNLKAELISDLKVWIDSCDIPVKDGTHWNAATSTLV